MHNFPGLNLCDFIEEIPRGIIWHTFFSDILLGHSIWHSIWHSLLAFYLTFSSGILSSDILSCAVTLTKSRPSPGRWGKIFALLDSPSDVGIPKKSPSTKPRYPCLHHDGEADLSSSFQGIFHRLHHGFLENLGSLSRWGPNFALGPSYGMGIRTRMGKSSHFKS